MPCWFSARTSKNDLKCVICLRDIDQLVTLSGMVTRTSTIVPEMREAFFKCAVCGAAAAAELERGRVPEPAHCAHCGTAHCFQLIHNRSHFSDKQLVKLQESPGQSNVPCSLYSIIYLYSYHLLFPHDRRGLKTYISISLK